MVSEPDSGASSPGSGPGWGHCAVLLDKTFYSHGASLYPGVKNKRKLMLSHHNTVCCRRQSLILSQSTETHSRTPEKRHLVM